MKVQFEVTQEEFEDCFSGRDFNHMIPLDVKLGAGEFICHIRSIGSYAMKSDWDYTPHYTITAEGFPKRQAEIQEATDLVYETKVAHKEAKRKLDELLESK